MERLLRAWAVPGKEGKLSFAMAEAESYIKFYNNFFGLKYPLKNVICSNPRFRECCHGKLGADRLGKLVFSLMMVVISRRGSIYEWLWLTNLSHVVWQLGNKSSGGKIYG